MKGSFFLVLLITLMIGIQPAFTQPAYDMLDEPAATEKADNEAEIVININLASDDEFIQALLIASDIELVNEENAKTDKVPNQGK
jgi:ABC-type glutathione transport system ATPase component